MKIIDMHAHVIPNEILSLVRAGEIADVRLRSDESGRETAILFGENPHPCTPQFYDPAVQLDFQDRQGIAAQAISVTPRLFFYERAAAEAETLCRLCNDAIIKQCAEYPGRFYPVGGLPMQDPTGAAAGRPRVGGVGGGGGTDRGSVGGRELDHPDFDPVYAAAEKLDMALMLHPLIVNRDPLTRRYHLSNLAGNPYQTTAAAGCLIFGGVFDRFPGLKVVLVHGGGFLPYQIGRFDHGFAVRPEKEHACLKPPSDYMARNLWFDGLTHGAQQLGLLLSVAGAGHVMFGTDYPYDMADVGQLTRMRELGCTEEELDAVAAGSFLRLTGGCISAK